MSTVLDKAIPKPLGCHGVYLLRKDKAIPKLLGCHGVYLLRKDRMWPMGSTSGKEPSCQCRRHKRCGFNPWVGKMPWRRAWQPTTVFLPRESHEQRRLVGWVHGFAQSQTRLKQYNAWHAANLHFKKLLNEYMSLFSCISFLFIFFKLLY